MSVGNGLKAKSHKERRFEPGKMEMVTKIDGYVRNSNRYAQPFVWTGTADSIFAKSGETVFQDSTLAVAAQLT